MFKPIAEILLLMLAVVACVSRHEVKDDYLESLGKTAIPSKTDRTVIVVLVDGLPVETLSKELAAGRLNNLRRFYIGQENRFYKARTSFPSLTFPSITSLLTGEPVDKNGVYGNSIAVGKERVDLEAINEYPRLNRMIAGRNVFARATAKGLRTVSFDYAFYDSTAAHSDVLDLKAGLSLAEDDYAYVDDKTIDSLAVLLKKTEPKFWPDFIFVHLIGVDLTSHKFGPQTHEVTDYLEGLDEKLGKVFSILNRIEAKRQRQIVSLLTADHGFDLPVTKVLTLEDSIRKLDPHIRILNEGRYLGLIFPESWPEAKRSALLYALAQNENIDVTALATGTRIEVQSAKLAVKLDSADSPLCSSGFALSAQVQGPIVASASNWMCEETLDEKTNSLFYPSLLPDLAHYFRAAGRPDAVVITKPGIALLAQYRGQHGGPTLRELTVPLLLHGAKVPETGPVPPLRDLLSFMN